MDLATSPELFPVDHQAFHEPPVNENGEIFEHNQEKSLEWGYVMSIISCSEASVDVPTITGKGKGKSMAALQNQMDGYRQISISESTDNDGNDIKGAVSRYEKVFVNNIRKCYKRVLQVN
ncbi:hypothetical protein FQR65_LT14546 [Abscondita terminalis]|nr:hypothetical protein FQR65_LT14546 [Abscondita terminalis]